MGNDRKYRLIGSVVAGSRIDRVEVEPPSEQYPDGKVLELHKPQEGRIGEPVELSSDQVTKLANHVVLELVEDDDEGAAVQTIDQTGPALEGRTSESTAGVTGTTPDIDSMDSEAVNAEINRIREQDPNALGDIKLNAKLEERKDALRSYYTGRGV